MIKNVPVEKLKDGKIHGLKVTVHSAFWTEKFLDWVMENHNISAEDLVKEILRINKKDYKDSDSYKHAIKNYECDGSLVSVKKGSGAFELTGYTNANDGDVIKFTIYMIAAGTVQVKIISPIDIPEEKKGMQNGSGVIHGVQTFVMKYSGFGKLARALMNGMEGKDPWTDEEGSTFDLTVGGFTDLLTMGASAPAALTNQGLNMFQEVLEQSSPEVLEEISGGREIIDLTTSSNKTELIANMIQLGLVTPELYSKYFGEEENTQETSN